MSNPGADWGNDPEVQELEHTFRAGLRADAEEAEQLAAKDLWRNRGLGDVAAELVQRGDVVAVWIGESLLRGVLVHAAGDLAVLHTSAGDLDVNLDAAVALRVLERARTGGRPLGGGARSFKARLAEHELAGADVELRCPSMGFDIRGRLDAVARDHAVITDAAGERVYVALAAIAAAVPLGLDGRL